MRRIAFALSAMLWGTCLSALSVAHAFQVAELCPMGGAVVVADVDRDKALAWAAGLNRRAVADADTADWNVLTLSGVDQDIAVLIGQGRVFFGVAGRGGEVYPQDLEKAFGKDFGKLRSALSKVLTELWKADVVKIDGADVQRLVDAAGLGSFEKEANLWVLKTRVCQPVDLPASGL